MKKIEKMTSAELKVFLEDRKMPTTGNKTELLLRAKKAVAEQPSSSTPVRQERDITTDPEHVASATAAKDDAAHANTNQVKDDDAQANANDEDDYAAHDDDAKGEEQKPFVAASSGEDKGAATYMFDLNADACDSDGWKDTEIEAIFYALDRWQKIEELQDKLEYEEWAE